MESLNPYGRTWLWHPTGAKVEVPLPSEPQAMFKAVNDYLAAGFTVEAPENAMKVEKLDVAFVVRFQKMNKHNRLQDNLYFYREHGEMGSDMTVYLNSDSDVAKFEEHSGLTVSSLPIYEGDAAPQRAGMQFPKFATPCKFTVTREKEAPSTKYANGRWILVDYVSSPMAQNAPKTPLISTLPDEGDKDTTDYQEIAYQWFRDNNLSVVTAMNDLHIQKNKMPSKDDKKGWAEFCNRYAEFLQKQKAAS